MSAETLGLALWVASIAVCVLLVGRSRLRQIPRIAEDRQLVVACAMAWILGVALLTIPGVAEQEGSRRFVWGLLSHDPGEPVFLRETVGNLVLLAPGGFLAGTVLRRTWAAFCLVVSGGVATASCIEFTQYLMHDGRAATSRDIVLNVGGALCGGALAQVLQNARPWVAGSGGASPSPGRTVSGPTRR